MPVNSLVAGLNGLLVGDLLIWLVAGFNEGLVRLWGRCHASGYYIGVLIDLDQERGRGEEKSNKNLVVR